MHKASQPCYHSYANSSLQTNMTAARMPLDYCIFMQYFVCACELTDKTSGLESATVEPGKTL